MKYFIMSCSHRRESQSVKVAHYLSKELLSLGHHVDLHDCGAQPLPLWTPDQNGEHWETWRAIEQKLASTDSFILVTPEWHGMATPQAKNVFLLVGQRLAHKPGLLVSVSSGRGGAYPIVELRQSSYKNSKIAWIPEHLIIREVESVLNETHNDNGKATEFSNADQWIRDRITYTLRHLELYSEALSSIRDRLPHEARFSNGM